MMKPFTSIPGPKCYPLIGSVGNYLFGPYNRSVQTYPCVYDSKLRIKGNIFRLKYHEALASMYKQFGPIVIEKIGTDKDIVHVFDPDDIKTVSYSSSSGRWRFLPYLLIKGE